MDFAQIVASILGTGWRFVRGYSASSDAVNAPGHHGWDIAARLGTPIPSFTSGKVVYAEDARKDVAKASANWATGGGNVVVVESGGIRYQYAHLDKISVRVGDTVSKGTLLGTVGQTGDATGPHLHFAMIDWRSSHRWINPSGFLQSLAGLGHIDVGDLPGFNFLVSFPIGHTLTEADINNIVQKLQDAGWFHDPNNASDWRAREETRAVLMTFVGKQWSPELQDQMAAALGARAETVDDNALVAIASSLGGFLSLLGKLLDPNNWIKIGALALGLFLFFTGFRTLMASASVAA